jgi:hypothetical protein
MPTNIPKARGILKAAMRYDDPERMRDMISDALSMMTRDQNQAGRGARIQRKQITGEVCIEVLRTHRAFPKMSFEEVGRLHGLAGGRVSEIVNGLRGPDGAMLPK